MTEIRDYFAQANGSRNGVPVEHMSANIVSQDFAQSYCEALIDDVGMQLVVNDYNGDPRRGPVQTNAVHDSFAMQFAKPLFVIINCVSNSPSHAQNSVLLNHLGTPGGGSDPEWAAAFLQWRALIDGVQQSAPELTGLRLNSSGIRFVLPGQHGRTNQVLASSNLTNWTVVASFYGTNGPIVFRDTNTVSLARRFYRVRRL